MLKWVGFKIFIQLCIIGSSIALCFYDFSDLENKSKTNQQMMMANNIFNTVFIFEAIFKIIAYGAYSTERSYFKDPWNIFDFALSFMGGISMLLGNKFQGFSRTILSFRPLRLVSSIKSMKRIATIIWLSTSSLLNVAILLLFAIFVFSV
jgi:hypothetical protein